MTFHEVEQQLAILNERRRLGQLQEEAYITAVNELRVVDDQLAWWQPDPYSGSWLRWDGTAWQPATPPSSTGEPPGMIPQSDARAQVAEPLVAGESVDVVTEPAQERLPVVVATDSAQPPASSAVTPTVESASPAHGGFPQWIDGVKRNVLSQADDAQSFINTSRTTPLRRRPESWWNALSIFGGAISGYFWFVYGSVSGLPTIGIFNGPFQHFTRFIIPLALLLIPIGMLIFRRRSAGWLAKIQSRFSRFSLVGKIAVFAVPLGLYHMFPTFLMVLRRVPFIARSPLLNISFGEGLDFITPLMMVGLPIAFIHLRRPIDSFLRSVNVLQKIPAGLRMGIGLAIPFLTAYLLNWLGFTQYPLLRINVLLGTVLSYLFVRTPRLLTPSPAAQPSPVPVSLLLFGLAALALCLADPALADCFLTDPFNFNDGLRTDGVAPILAGVATATVSILVNGVEVASVVFQDTKPVEEGEDPDRRNYSVQVRTLDAQGKQSTLVREGDPGVIYIYAYCMNESGAFPDGDATITFPTDLGSTGLTITDMGTQYQQRCACVSMPSPVQGSVPPSITVTVRAGHGKFSIPVTLQVDAGLALSAEMINSQQSRAVQRAFPVYDAWTREEEGTWTFTELITYFHTAQSSEPTKPGFNPVWEAPVVMPEYIELTSLTCEDDNLTWRCQAKMKESVKIPEDWLASDGVITVTFTGKQDPQPGTAGATYTAKMGLRLPPMVEVACRFEEDDREYAGVTMEENQFLCDGVDELPLIFYPHDRTDKDDPDSIAEYELEKVECTLDDDAKKYFTLTEDTEYQEQGLKRFLIKSNAVLLFNTTLPAQVSIQMKAKAHPTTGDAGTTIDLTGKVTLKPGYVFLKLWVVGGGARGTSEACCFACMSPNAANVLSGITLALKVETVGNAGLSIDGADRAVTDDNGIAKWILRYSGLTWETYAGALFQVRCGMPLKDEPPVKATEVSINIYDNVTQLIQTIFDQQDAINLNNNGFSSNCLDYAFPDDMSGPYTNMRSWIFPDWDAYICGSYSSRIFGWMGKRKFGVSTQEDPDPLQCMNGIEINEYAIWDLGPVTHHFAGFHLSGTGPVDSPRFIDPWWYQGWRDPKLRTLYGLYTKNSERYLIVKSIAFKAVIALLLVKAAVAVGAVAATTKLYAIIKAGGIGLGVLTTTAGDVHEYGVQANDFTSDGKYAVYRTNWPVKAAAHLKATHSTVPPVEKVTNW